MLVIIAVLVGCYCIAIAWLAFLWSKMPQVVLTDQNEYPMVSIIVPVRNEENNITTLLDCLVHQNFPKINYEVIIVNDHSADTTIDMVEEYLACTEMQIRLLHLGNFEGSPKKNALALGIAHAMGDVIVTTDGDCTFGKDWLRSMVIGFTDPTVQLIMGPVKFCLGGFFQAMQWVELSALMGISAVSAYIGRPLMGNGANLAFRKSAYLEVGGYHGHISVPSGDDEFLVKGISEHFGAGAVLFNKCKQAIVSTAANAQFSGLYHQRVRWASKWKKHKGIGPKLAPLLLFLFYVVVIISWVYFALGFISPIPFLAIMLVKFITNWLFVGSMGKFFNQQHSIIAILMAEIIYPIYTIFFGLASIFGKYQWKGRKFP